MVGTVKLDIHGNAISGHDFARVAPAIAQDGPRQAAAAETDIVDSSGGAAAADGDVPFVWGNLVNEADDGTSLADKAETDAALATVHDGIAELFDRANAVAAAISMTGVVYNGGGTAPNGTVDAVTVSVTAAVTGVQADETNASITALSGAMLTVASLINRMTSKTGKNMARLDGHGTSDPVAAITIDTGVAADPGVSKASVDAALAQYANNIATLSALLTDMTTAYVPAIEVG